MGDVIDPWLSVMENPKVKPGVPGDEAMLEAIGIALNKHGINIQLATPLEQEI